MNDNVTTIFDQYTRYGAAATAAATAAEVAAAQPAYQAYGVSKVKARQARLRVHYQDGTIGLLAYAYLMEVLCTSHQYLSLIYTNTILTLEGQQLHELVEPLQDEKIRSLHCFHANYFTAPTADTPLISSIERQGPEAVAR